MRGGPPPPPPPRLRDDLRFSNTTGILKKKTIWFIGVEVEQETSAPPLKKILDPPLTQLNALYKLIHLRLTSVFWSITFKTAAPLND